MNDDEVKQILLKDLKFTENDVNKLEVLKKSLLEYNSKYNLSLKVQRNQFGLGTF